MSGAEKCNVGITKFMSTKLQGTIQNGDGLKSTL